MRTGELNSLKKIADILKNLQFPISFNTKKTGWIDGASWYRFDAREGEEVVLHVIGWAIDPFRNTPASSVWITTDDKVIAQTSTGLPRPDVAASLDSHAFLHSGWQAFVPGHLFNDKVTIIRAHALVDNSEKVISLKGEVGVSKNTKPRQLIRPDPKHLWIEDFSFQAIMKQVQEVTLVDEVRCYVIFQLAQQVNHLNGDIAEVGVYKGGTAKLLVRTFEGGNKAIHLFDTFAGMPPTDSTKDLHKEGDFSDTSLESVKSFLGDCRNVRFYPGVFPETAKVIEDERFCLIHIDADLYRSITDCCEFFYPRMERGGVMVVDDYGSLSCPGAKKAVDDYFRDKPENPLYLPTGQCIIIRL